MFGFSIPELALIAILFFFVVGAGHIGKLGGLVAKLLNPRKRRSPRTQHDRSIQVREDMSSAAPPSADSPEPVSEPNQRQTPS